MKTRDDRDSLGSLTTCQGLMGNVSAISVLVRLEQRQHGALINQYSGLTRVLPFKFGEKLSFHELTSFAVVEGDRITYPQGTTETGQYHKVETRRNVHGQNQRHNEQ